MSEIGHNSGIAGEQLQSIIERLERLEEDKAAVMMDIKEVLAEAKGNGFDTKPIKRLVALRKQDRAKAIEDRQLLELYAEAIGCLDLI
jgi:uncharacterized protein (UPF0335 family)